MPLLALVIPVKVLAPAWTLLGIASSATILGSDRAHVDKRAFAFFLPWCIAGIGAGLYLDGCALEKRAFRATISAMLLALSLIRLVAYAAVGELGAESLMVFAAALPIMALGIYLGGRIHAAMSEALFKRLVCGILVVCAIPLLLK